MFYFCHATGIVQSSWFIFTLQLLKVSSRLSTRNSQVQIVVLWLFLPRAVALLTPAREAFHLNRHEKVLVTFG
jgi:hypothetical protein